MKNQNKLSKIALIECPENKHFSADGMSTLKAELNPTILSDAEIALQDLENNNHSIYLLGNLPQNQDPYKFFYLAKRKGFEGNMIFLVNEEIEELAGGVDPKFRPPVDFLKTKKIKSGEVRKGIQKIIDNPLNPKNSKNYLSLKSIFESLSIMFYVERYTPKYHFEYLSPAFEYLGYTLEDFYADTDLMNKIMEPSDFLMMKEKNQEIYDKSKEETDYEYRVYNKEGEVRWWKDCGRPIFNERGEKVNWFGVIYDITDRKNAELTSRKNEKNYRDFIENAHDMIYQHDLKGNLKTINKAVKRITGYSVEEALRLNIKDFIVPEHFERANQEVKKKLKGERTKPYEIQVLGKKNQRVCLEISSRLIYKNNKPFLVEGIARNITRRKKLMSELDRFYNLSFDILATLDFQGNFLQVNPTWEKILGHFSDTVLNRSIINFVHPDDIEKTSRYVKKISLGESVSLEIRMRCENGAYRWFEWGFIPVLEDEVSYAVARDITERKESERKLEYNALHDSLTGLPNRKHFLKHLDLAIERAKIEPRFKFAVLFIDLDRFKVVNDSLGHIIGDKLLIKIAETLKACVRPSDVIARMGGDEFTILVSLKDPSEAELVATRIQEKIGVPFQIENYEVFTSASVGIIISDDQDRKSEEFLRDADTAMYQAKDAGKARYEFYSNEMHARNINLLQVETDLRRAIENREFRVFYQPIVNLQTGEISEFESLIRWQHPEKGLVFPDEFIGVAEETGLIIPIGSWVLEESCRQILEWEKRLDLPLQISINLSAKQLMHPFLVRKIEKVISDLNINPEKIKLEVTESTVMDNTEVALKTIEDLHQIGVRLSTDDFGTGYSSLSYLHLFPFERIKIDRSFIGKMDTDFKREGIVRSIMMLGQNLEIDIVAEGIENESQLWQLRSLGCKLGQGWLFSKAVDAPEAERLLREGLDFDFGEMEVPFAFSSEYDTNSSIHITKPQ